MPTPATAIFSATQSPPNRRRRSKRMRAVIEAVGPPKSYPLDEALQILRQHASVKFDESLDIVIRLGVDPRHSEQMVRGVCELPHGTGRTLRIAVFAKGDEADEARSAGADIVGSEDLIETIQKGEIKFDRCIASPDMMPLVGRVGKILGPRGLMPNPKTGTVTRAVGRAVEAAKRGSVEFRVERASLVHAGIGRISFSQDKLRDNALAFVDAVRRAKPSAVKGTYLKAVNLSSTMGPGLAIDMASLARV